MSNLTCPYSGIQWSCPGLPFAAYHPHPVFSLSPKKLYALYSLHMKGSLQPVDSYLLSLAYLKASGYCRWDRPSEQPSVIWIDSHLSRLVAMVELLNSLPSKAVTLPTLILSGSLDQVEGWLEECTNIVGYYKDGLIQESLASKITKLENKLFNTLQDASDRQTAISISEWANLIAGFPSSSRDLWMATIRKAYNKEAMFYTDLSLLKEIKEFCICEIDPMATFFHKLMEILNHAITSNQTYLGFNILDDEDEEEAIPHLEAPSSFPAREDYPSDLEFLKAKLRYQIAHKRA